MVAYISLSTQALISIEMIFRWMGAVVGCNAAWERVNSILGRETEPELPRQTISSVETLSAEDLGFGYEEGKSIFRHRSFTVSRGEILLITGRSGSGKSTLFRCLMGLYQPGEGRVQLDGKPVSGRELLAGVGFVPAQHTFYAGTIYENITLGDHTISRETCLKNARRLGIGDWLEEVGLDHLLLENASDLSGGQKQILSVLRAVNFDAPILILDEPFASLDAGRREKLTAFLEEYKRDHLVILTSHQEEQLDGVKVCPMN